MKTVSFIKANSDLKAVLDSVANETDITIITRKGADDVVVMSLGYYHSLMETVHLLRSPRNTEHLNRSIAECRAEQT
nr:type II toxin-antitoxin system prevent-host-death family antitoxin [uncultured Halomonas sp.]